MEKPGLLLLVAAAAVFALAASAFALVWAYGRRRGREAEQGAVREKVPPSALKRWRRFLIAWPLVCLALSGLMLHQWLAGMENRDPVHAVFPLFSLVFFFIGMGTRHSTAKKRALATLPAERARVVTLNAHFGHHGTVKTPVYEYTAKGGTVYTVSSRTSYNPCPVHTGQEVALYYSPKDPRTIYVPKEESAKGRWSLLLCGVGVLFPLIALIAPWLERLLPA